jgi:hypothetical protein
MSTAIEPDATSATPAVNPGGVDRHGESRAAVSRYM